MLRDIKTLFGKTSVFFERSLNHVALLFAVLHNKFNKNIVNIYCRRCCFTYIKMSIELLAKFSKTFFSRGKKANRTVNKDGKYRKVILRHEMGV